MELKKEIINGIKYIVLDLEYLLVIGSKRPFYYDQIREMNEQRRGQFQYDSDDEDEKTTGRKDIYFDHPEHKRYLVHHQKRNRLIFSDGYFLLFRPYLDDFIDFLLANIDTIKVGVWSLNGSSEEVNTLAKIVFQEYYKHLEFVYHGSMKKSLFKSKKKDLDIVWKNNPTWPVEKTWIIEPGKEKTLYFSTKKQKVFGLYVESFSENSFCDNTLLAIIKTLKFGIEAVVESDDLLSSGCLEVFSSQVTNKILHEHEISTTVESHFNFYPYIFKIIKDYYNIEIPIADTMRIPLLNSNVTNANWQIFFGRCKGLFVQLDRKVFQEKLGRKIKSARFIGSLNAINILEKEEFFVEIQSEQIQSMI